MSSLYENLLRVLANSAPEGPAHGYSNPYNSTPNYPMVTEADKNAYGMGISRYNGWSSYNPYQGLSAARDAHHHAVAVQKARRLEQGVGDVYGPADPGGFGVNDHVQPLAQSPAQGGADPQVFLREQQQAYKNHPDPREEAMRDAPEVLKGLARALQPLADTSKGGIEIEIKHQDKKVR